MEQYICNRLFELKLRSKKLSSHGKYMYKYSPDSKYKLIDLDENRDKLTEEYYGFAEKLLFTKREEYFGFAMLDYKKYKTVYDALQSGLHFNKKELLLKVNEAVLELKKIGWTYYDVHSKNILILNEQIKLIDLDEIELTSIDSEKEKLHCFINFMFELYFAPYFNEQFFSIHPHFRELNLKKYYSSSFVESIEKIMAFSNKTIDTDVVPLINELADEEKTNCLIRKEILCKRLY